jgi:pSer/pThr/pTyr-binding forkhead associated (FHA) protein
VNTDIKKPSVTIGRDRDADISILDPLISRSHARISYENGEYWIEDIGSRNGTYIWTRKITERTRLTVGEIFRAGASEMRLV